MQKVIKSKNLLFELKEIFSLAQAKKILLVCDSVISFLPLENILTNPSFNFIFFDKVLPNPTVEIVSLATETYLTNNCDAILAIGGGSVIDVAKSMKNNLIKTKHQTPILIALPTTAGTGSESTKFAVIYDNGKKLSIENEQIIPDYALLVPEFLKNLPTYQKKCTVFDALAQAIESLWSVNSTEESSAYAKKAIELLVPTISSYVLENKYLEEVSLAANFAGRAINISKTTAPHAMSYKLTDIYGFPHGHAVALCLPKVWRFMTEHPEKIADTRGKDYIKKIFLTIAKYLNKRNESEAIDYIESLINLFDFERPRISNEDLDVLVNSVNIDRLSNNPIKLEKDDLKMLYLQISK